MYLERKLVQLLVVGDLEVRRAHVVLSAFAFVLIL